MRDVTPTRKFSAVTVRLKPLARFCSDSSLEGSLNEQDSSIKVGETGQVGIFWGLPSVAPEFDVVADALPLRDAEPYGDFLTHPRGHYEVWERWRRAGPAGLKAQGLPSAIAWKEYDEVPRGRIVYERPSGSFILYADRLLQTPSVLSLILVRFGLTAAKTRVRSDQHYTTN
jgi:hypothetical protein